jgi:predicted secreted acid phosphatase
MHPFRRSTAGLVAGLAGLSLLLAPVAAEAKTAPVAAPHVEPGSTTHRLTPRTTFTMKPDGSSGKTEGGDGIPNIDSVKKTIAAYYGDPGTGIADKTSSPYITELTRIMTAQRAKLVSRYRTAVRHGERPALVFDTDDTTLFTYDMEVADMHFTFTSAEQDAWVHDQRFPATPLMVDYVNTAAALGYRVFGVTGRNDDQKADTLANLRKVGYTAFSSARFYTKWVSGGRAQPGYVHCVATCTTVEYKAQTRKHIERLGYDIVANYGDQWSDLQGGYADHAVKLPNPTYYLPSTNLPGVKEPELAPRTRFTMAPDGSSGTRVSGEAIPNIDSVKKTIAVYYGDPGTGIAATTSSPYVSEMRKIIAAQRATLQRRYDRAVLAQEKPALVFDADDTTLFTYDMEVADMHFTFTPAAQDVWVQDQRFAATPQMVAYVNAAADIGYTVFGLTGRNDDQKAATLSNLAKVGYRPFTADRFFTKWTGTGTSQQPAYVDCGSDARCSTIEYKAQTRQHIEQLGYTVVANYGDQYSDLLGGYAERTVKLPNPTYYLP